MSCCSNCQDNSGDCLSSLALQPAKLGGWIDTAVNAGLKYLSSANHPSGPKPPVCSPPNGCFKCLIKGQGGIAGCIDNVSQQWITAAHARDAGQLDNPTLLAITQNIVAGLSNPAFFDPQNDSYLVSAKQVFQQRAADIQALMQSAAIVNNVPSNVGNNPTVTPTQNTAQSQPVSLIDELLNDKVLFYGGIAVVVLLLTRGK